MYTTVRVLWLYLEINIQSCECQKSRTLSYIYCNTIKEGISHFGLILSTPSFVSLIFLAGTLRSLPVQVRLLFVLAAAWNSSRFTPCGTQSIHSAHNYSGRIQLVLSLGLKGWNFLHSYCRRIIAVFCFWMAGPRNTNNPTVFLRSPASKI